MEYTYEDIKLQTAMALEEYFNKTMLQRGDIFIVGCSTSEIKGHSIGKGSDINAAAAVYEALSEKLEEEGLYLAVQCCEHLNRAIIIERKAMKPWQEQVNVVPDIHAGGSLAVTAYNSMKEPVALEHIQAAGGMDIGDTFIGMHLKDVVVPVRIGVKAIGHAHLTCARTRPKFIGGSRAIYDDALIGGEIRR